MGYGGGEHEESTWSPPTDLVIVPATKLPGGDPPDETTFVVTPWWRLVLSLCPEVSKTPWWQQGISIFWCLSNLWRKDDGVKGRGRVWPVLFFQSGASILSGTMTSDASIATRSCSAISCWVLPMAELSCQRVWRPGRCLSIQPGYGKEKVW